MEVVCYSFKGSMTRFGHLTTAFMLNKDAFVSFKSKCCFNKPENSVNYEYFILYRGNVELNLLLLFLSYE